MKAILEFSIDKSKPYTDGNSRVFIGPFDTVDIAQAYARLYFNGVEYNVLCMNEPGFDRDVNDAMAAAFLRDQKEDKDAQDSS